VDDQVMNETQYRGRIVVGIDGSIGSEQALHWAVKEARARDLDIDVVHAWSPPLSIYPVDLSADAAAYQAAGADVLAHALAGVDDRDGDGHITRHLAQDNAASALIKASAGAELLVVGSRGRGGFTGLLLGSVGRTCLHLASVPTVVVPPEWQDRTTRSVVVGVDGSGPSRAALAWALTEAAAHDATLRIVNVYDLAPYISTLGTAVPPDSELIDRSSRALLEEVTADAKDSGVEVEVIAASGPTAKTLLGVASGADLLVVGSRGLGGLRRLLLGSVSEHCVYHSSCPVAVVRTPEMSGADATEH
jgi:nucleotide-binding universal stress UspA family protein